MYSSLLTVTMMLLPEGILILNITPSLYFFSLDSFSSLAFRVFSDATVATGSG